MLKLIKSVFKYLAFIEEECQKAREKTISGRM